MAPGFKSGGTERGGMCRFVAYHGPPIGLDELLYEPNHSIVDQSVEAREREEPLNGDGWGVGWYEPDRDPEPAVYREVRPAWNDDNMREVSPLVETPLYFAHVRAASPGLAVQQLNCHPFPGGRRAVGSAREPAPAARGRRRLLFMHNGALGAYRDVIRRLREELAEELYFGIRGSTDSEHAFAVIQEQLGDAARDPGTEDLATAVRDGLAYLERLKDEVGGGDRPTTANVCLTDGESVVATRYASPADAAAQSLYVGEAGSFVAYGEFVATPDPIGDAATLVASEPLFEDDRVWREVPRNHLVTVAPDGETTVEPLALDVPT
jgi:predicted glutamine amidotransferase